MKKPLVCLTVFVLVQLCILPSQVWAGKDAGRWNTAELRVVLNSDIRSTDPGVRRDSITDTVMAHIVEPLVGYRENLSIGPQLAQSYQVSEDGKTYTFKLRDGVTFHNGEPVTARDVKWTWERFLNPETHWSCRTVFDGSARKGGRHRGVKILSIETPDKKTVVFHLDGPNATFLDRMAALQCDAGIIHPRSVGPDGHWQSPIGTGPYKLKEWRKGEYVLLERYDGYKPRQEKTDGFTGAKYAYAKDIKFIVMPDPASALVALYSGDVDIYPGLPSTAYQEAVSRKNINVSSAVTLTRAVLLIQTRDPLLSNIKIRKAIAHAINRKALAKIVTSGLAAPNPSAVQVVSPYWDKTQGKWWAYDTSAAKRLLREAGYRGELVSIQTNRKFPFMYRNALTIQAMLQNIGMNVKLDVLDWTTQLASYMAGKFQLSTMQFSARTDPALGYGIIIGNKDKKPWRQWENPEAMRLVDMSESETDIKKRQDLFDQLHLLMMQDVPIEELYNLNFIIAARKNVKGIQNWSIGKPLLWNVWKQ